MPTTSEPYDAREAALERLASLADFFGAAIFLQGRCDGLKVEDCVARSTLTPTYTSLSVARTDASPTNFKAYVDLIDTHLAAPEAALSARPRPTSRRHRARRPRPRRSSARAW